MTPISVIRSEANIGTVPCLFNTCLIRLMPSVPAINEAVRADTQPRNADAHIQAHAELMSGFLQLELSSQWREIMSILTDLS